MYYFDNAATTFPKPESVVSEMCHCMQDYCANPGRAGHKMALAAGRKVYEAREAVAEFIGAEDPSTIVFTSNATVAINMAIKGLLKNGDHVISTTMEHNSVARPLYKLNKQGIIDLTFVEADREGRIDTDAIEKAIQPNTRLILVTHASNVTGTIMPIEAISAVSKKNGCIFMVDASQTAGILPLNVTSMGIDLLAAPGHKGLMGPQGTGILYVSPKVHINPLFEGGTGSKSEDLNQPEMMPDRLESGTTNTPGLVGLLAGIEHLNKVGLKKIREHEQELRKMFIEGLAENKRVEIYGVKDDGAVGVVSLNIEGLDSSEVTYTLDAEFSICTRSGLHCAPLAHTTLGTLERGTVRFSFGYYNTKEEVKYAIDAIKQLTERQ